ncbi:MAG: hypothetical protein LKI29_08420, partial [Bacteroides sp.]|nr:hypothetical protein [Bacteroides sp.]
LNGVGIGKAVDIIQKMGLPVNKSCRIIVLDNNVPQVSLYYHPIIGDTVPQVNRRDWKVSSDLGRVWKQVRKVKRKNSSLFKVDFVVYPELKLKNLVITQIYQVLFNLNPAIEVSLWNGMKVMGQVIIPIYNEYGSSYSQVRQGYITLSQSLRFPHNIFLTATIGTFNNSRWGGDLSAKYIFKDERFFIEGSVGYTGRSRFTDWRWKVSPIKRLTWSIGANFYWPKYNTQFALTLEQYLLSEKGIQFQMIRHFRYTSIGFYGMKVQHAGNKGFNGGFRFQIALPPYKYKRKGYIPRILPSEYFGMSYNAGNEQYYGRSFNPRVYDNIASDNSFNPYFIESELLNY